MPGTNEQLYEALRRFADSVAAKMKALAPGEPEDQLRAPLETFLSEAGRALGPRVVAKGESQLPGRLGRPDYAVLAGKLLAGYIELKEPGKGADPARYRGHDRRQWERFTAVPNILYTDGNEWGLYRQGQRVGPLVRLSGDITERGKSAVKPGDVEPIRSVLADFLSWEPPPVRDAKALAELLAPLCGMLRRDVVEAMGDPNSPLAKVAAEWRQLLFPDADNDRFADAYAQTVTFALLLARSEGASTIDLHDPIQKLAADHALLSRALQEMTDQQVQAEIAPSLRLLQRVIDRVPQEALADKRVSDPWLYFYEDFLAAYDPALRKDAGAYYTPVQVVRAQVRLIDRLLVERLGRPLGYAESTVFTLDPAVGTGTYLLGVIDHAMQRIEESQGSGAVPGYATELGQRIFGFEIMVGPYAVAQLRVSRALIDRGATLPHDGPGVYLTDTLESPNAQAPQNVMGWAQREMADQHSRATRVKKTVPVLVCLGNPPYDRHEAVQGTDPASLAHTGGWVRYGDTPDHRESVGGSKKKTKARSKPKTPEALAEETLDWRQKGSILFKAFVEPALAAGHGGDVKNLYNLYIYFWRWALWKVFEHSTASGPGVVSFISAASYIDGDAFVGVRQQMRRVCDEVWVLDLGGEGRGTRKSENVFAIQTPVVIAIGVCYRKPNMDQLARVHYTRIDGTRNEKLAKLEAIADFADLTWQRCPDEWQAPFRPAGKGAYFDWPLLIDLLPWQHSGVQLKRTWPIAPNQETLELRWRALLSAKYRSEAFHGTGDREVHRVYRVALTAEADFKPIAQLPKDAPTPPVMGYAYRSFDRQRIIADGRLMSRPRPDLWAAHGSRQVYLTSLFSQPLGAGPALTACAELPDLDHFRGSYGAKAAMPLYRDANGEEANVLPGLLDSLARAYGRPVSAEDFLAYVYGVLAQPAFTERFGREFESRELRVPLTKGAGLFERVAEVGRRLLWLHTYGQRFFGTGRHEGQIPRGAARCTRAVSEKPDDYPDSYNYEPGAKRLTVGSGRFEPVEPEVYAFDVSGLKVVQSWLGYRMRTGKGKKSSPLDGIRPERWTAQFTTELLELLWVLEATLAIYPDQAQLLAEVLVSDLLPADALPTVPEYMRGPERRGKPLIPEEN